VQFNGGSTTGYKTGTLTISSNDVDEPTTIVNLAGYFQRKPEGGFESPLANLVNTVFGYQTNIVNAGQNINTGGQAIAVGDEVMSGYWQRAYATDPVIVRQLWAFHTQGNTAALKWYLKGSSTQTTLFTSAGVDAQTFFPRETDLKTPAGGNFTPGANATFGFRVDNEWSDDTKNVQEHPGGGWGHHMRFFPLRDENGNLVPNTYLMVMDYNGINYDYNDNAYLITNIKPAT
jgi:hypothetical protein